MIITRRRAIKSGLALTCIPFASPAISQANRRVTLNVSHGFSGQFIPTLVELSELFTRLNPDINIRYSQDGNNWGPQLQSTLRKGIIGDLPDLSHQSLTFTRILAERNYAQPLDPLIGNIDELTRSGIPRPLLKSCQFGNGIFALPVSTTLPILYYNMNLIERAGYKGERPPATWDEVITNATRVSNLGGGIVGGYLEYSAANVWIFQNILASLGGRMAAEDESDIAFDSSEGLETLRIFHSFGTAMTTDMTQEQARQTFNSGNTGVLVRSASGLQSVVDSVGRRFKLDIRSFPIPNKGSNLVGAGNGVVLFSRDPYKKEAVEAYIRFIIGPDAQILLAKRTGYMPINMNIVNNSQYLSEYYENNSYQKISMQHLSTASDWYSFPKNTVQIFEAMTNEMRLVINHKKTPESALETMAVQTRKLMKGT